MVILHGFERIREEEIPELMSRAELYRHRKTGAELLSLINQDENKVFGIGFRTVPQDSTGAPHILEHAVLAGSEKYPVKEPFIELVKGSLASFVNAMTFEDRTVYPIASQNLQDFYNLIDVYLDAVFHPLLEEQTFLREGWHIMLEEAQASPSLRGVVFNEMKGQYSTPDYILFKEILRTLFPETPYAYASAGDPSAIPDLTFEGLKRFYATFYHPSNARIFFYGDDPPEERLRRMDEVLSGYDRLDTIPEVRLQPRLPEPQRVVRPYPVGEDDENPKHMVAVSWLLPENADPSLGLSLDVLAHALMGLPASPVRKALIDSGLGEEVIGSGYDDNFGLWSRLRQHFFTLGMKGVQEEDVDRVEAIILETLEALAERGLDKTLLDAALNTIEFRLRENNIGGLPRGLLLMLRAMGVWNYGHDPLEALFFEEALSSIRQQWSDPEATRSMLRSLLCDNSHRITLNLAPDPGFQARLAKAERERLEAIEAGLDPASREALVEQTRRLQRLQEEPDDPADLAKLPMLSREDLEPQAKRIPLEEIALAGSQVLLHEMPTYGIAYLDVGLNLHTLPAEMLRWARIFGRALLEMGTERRDFVELSQHIGRDTGGIEAETMTSGVWGAGGAQAWLFLRGKAMISKVGALLSLLEEILGSANLEDRERFRQIVLEEKAGLEASLLPAGHQWVAARLRAGLDEAGWAQEQMGGITYLFFLRDLAKRIDADWERVAADLKTLRESLIRKENMLFNLTLDPGEWGASRASFAAFVGGLPSGPSKRSSWERGPLPAREGLAVSAGVNYVGMAADLGPLGYELHGSALVANLLLRTSWLWERVRLQGGAYGAFSLLDLPTRIFSQISYRDPNLEATLETFSASGSFLRELALPERELTKAIIGTIGRIDAYQLPDAKGFTSMRRWLTGMTDDLRQRIRDEVLRTSLKDLQAFGAVLEGIRARQRVAILGSEEKLQAWRQALGPETVEITPVF